jgi:dipeptidyl aminopeptidase/acylaminoacyl peptidase
MLSPRLYLLLLLPAAPCAAQPNDWPKRLPGDRVEAHWSEDGRYLRYRTPAGNGDWQAFEVDLASGKQRALDSLPSAMITALKASMPDAENGPATTITFRNDSPTPLKLFWRPNRNEARAYGTIVAGKEKSQTTYAGHVWEVRKEDGTSLGFLKTPRRDSLVTLDGSVAAVEPQRSKGPGKVSPGGRHRALIRDHNVWIATDGGKPSPWTRNGSDSFPYVDPISWSPDSRRVLVRRQKPAPHRQVKIIESAPEDSLQPVLHRFDYRKPGDDLEQPELRVLEVGKAAPIEVETRLHPNSWSLSRFHWAADASEVFALYNERGHQTLRVIGIEASTGKTRTVVEETSATFIDYSQKTELHWLDESQELIWASERDGWNHLYLYDIAKGRVKRQLTRGEWVVRDVLRVDAEARVLYLMASGIHADQDPYHQHLVAVHLDRGEFRALTTEDGTHEIEWSPDHESFIDRWSRIDRPPVHQLRRTLDGILIAELSRADGGPLVEAGWRPPERFTAAGRDGVTPIHGFLIRPCDFDPNLRYPVIECIYAGPHGQHVPKRFGLQTTLHELADFGFIVVRIDGMGTNWRSKAFHDVCWKNLKDAGFPDRIAWMKEAATTRPWMDLSRVGIYGGSAGGQNALAALLHHGDFYRVAAADCGCHDNRMDKIWWNEAWMGWPVDEAYADSSNVTHAHRLQGKLLLTVGELDRNVDPASTMQVVDALIEADKDFDLIVLPGKGHGAGESPYGQRRRRDFFIEHLQPPGQ